MIRPAWLRNKINCERQQRRDPFVGIPKHIVRQWRERKLDDYRVCKRLDDDQLDDMMRRLPVRPPIWSKLRKLQKVCLLIGAMTQRFYFGNDMGTGKSLLAIALCLYFIKLGKVKRALILVPNKTNKGDWAKQAFDAHAPNVPYLILEGSSADKWNALAENDAPFVIETYSGFMRMVSESIKSRDKNKDRLDINRRAMADAQQLFQAIVFDEITMAKTKGTLTFRVGRFLSNSAHVVFGLSGTPFGKNPEDLWAQFFLVDLGVTLGETLGMFRAAFFTAKARQFGGGYDYKFRRSMDGTLKRMMAHRFIRYEADETDLPPVIPLVRYVDLPAEAEPYYKSQLERLRAVRGNVSEMKNVFMRMRQISSGFMGGRDEHDAKVTLEFTSNPKLEKLITDIRSTDRKCVVFHDFIISGAMIGRALKEYDIGYSYIYGGTKDPEVEMAKFAEDPAVQICILNNAAGGFGLDRLKVAQYALYYESPVGLILRKQTERRVERQGSHHSKVFRYDYVVRGTWDERILAAHAAGRELFDDIIDGRERY